MNHLKTIGLPIENDEKYIRAPDFTAGLNRGQIEIVKDRVGLVPNMRMCDMLDIEFSDYCDQLNTLVHRLSKVGKNVSLIIHENEDMIFEQKVTHDEIVRGDALQLKSYISSCEELISSRYHACVSAMSNGVPTVTVGWSHKYQELHNEWGVTDLLCASFSDVFETYVRLHNDRTNYVNTLEIKGAEVNLRIDQMWSMIIEKLQWKE